MTRFLQSMEENVKITSLKLEMKRDVQDMKHTLSFQDDILNKK